MFWNELGLAKRPVRAHVLSCLVPYGSLHGVVALSPDVTSLVLKLLTALRMYARCWREVLHLWHHLNEVSIHAIIAEESARRRERLHSHVHLALESCAGVKYDVS
jgi:hypothetical protein